MIPHYTNFDALNFVLRNDMTGKTPRGCSEVGRWELTLQGVTVLVGRAEVAELALGEAEQHGQG